MSSRKRSLLIRLISAFGLVVALGLITIVIVAPDALACATKGFAHRCYTATGIVNWTSSEVGGRLLLGDEEAELEDTGNGTFRTIVSTPLNQKVACSYDALDGNLAKPALCSYPQGIACTGFVAGSCDAKTGTRTSFMACNAPNTGCTGEVTIELLDGSLPPFTINVAKDTNLDSPKECNDAFPNTAELPRGIGGKVIQACTSKQAIWSADDEVREYAVRNQISLNVANTASYRASGKWAQMSFADAAPTSALCSPDDGFPPVSCTNFGSVRSTFPAASIEACTAANLRCGQRASSGEVGPAPSECTFDSASQQCSCTCPKCAVDTGETLTNVGVPPSPGTQGTGSYVVSHVDGTNTARIAHVCLVKVGGN